MKLLQIENIDAIVDNSIKRFAQQSSTTRFTYHYLIQRSQNEESGFLSVDIRPNVDYLVIYGLFVPKSLRNQGIATEALLEAERLAKTIGLRRVIVYPQPLEDSIDKENLINWYRKRGFNERPDFPDELEKAIQP